MEIIPIVVLFLSVMATSIVIYFLRLSEKIVNMFLYFSGAFLLSLAFTQIIPEIFEGEHHHYLGYFVLAGFFLQIFIEYFSGGAEHGHQHSKSNEVSDYENGNKVQKFNSMALLIGISVHSLFEGMPFSGHFHNHQDLENILLFGIVIHNIPIAIVLMSLFLGAGYSNIKSFFYLFLFALAAPLGSVISYFGGTIIHDVEQYYQIVMALVVGIFFHIATIILYEGEKGHKFNLYKFFTIIVGIAVALAVGHSH